MHVQDRTRTASTARTATSPASTAQADELLRLAVATDLGPRRPGTIYRNVDGTFEVLDVILDRDTARQLLKRRAAQFAVRIIDRTRPDAQPFHVGSV